MKREHRAKRIGAILVLALILAGAMTVTAFGAKSSLEVVSTTPKDGDTGMAIENMGVKVFFSEEIYSTDNAPGNIGKCSMKDEDGNKVPTQVVFSAEDPTVMLVLADPNNSKTDIKGNSEYTLTIDEGFVAVSGNELAEPYTVKFTTLNPRNSMIISMGMMVAMIGGMLFFTMRDAKKKTEEGKKKTGYEAVNPYKEAKRTGKSVEDIVAEEKKKKEKFEAKEAKEAKKARREKEDEEEAEEAKNDNLRVPRPRPISEAGSGYKAPKN
ncbi:MAG: Ig-like domain-containing protein [Clostridiales bacterium]|nr:Ig-like domain-containing protein [Clostridiales bacterium]